MNTLKQLFYAILLCLFLPIAYSQPHFYIVMVNQSNRDTTLHFTPVSGNVSLIPTMEAGTILPAFQRSRPYGVEIAPMGRGDVFNIYFTGKQECVFTIAFYEITVPRVTVSGCIDGRYRILGNIVFLSIYDIGP